MSSGVLIKRKDLESRVSSSKGVKKIQPITKPVAKQAKQKIPLLDLTRKYQAIAADLRPEWENVFASMRLLNGVNLAAFEREFADYCSVKHAIGVASGTDAIYLSLRALDITAGDEVILPAHVPAPVIEPVLAVGATPVLIDKAIGDYGPDLKGLKNAISFKTKAILAVHMLGLPCDMRPLSEIAQNSGVALIEDASQAQGATYETRRAAGLGTITPMSLGPVKNLACYGDGGIVLTDDDNLAATGQALARPRPSGKIRSPHSRLEQPTGRTPGCGAA